MLSDRNWQPGGRTRSGSLSRNEVAGVVDGQLDQRKAEERRLGNCGATNKHSEGEEDDLTGMGKRWSTGRGISESG